MIIIINGPIPKKKRAYQNITILWFRNNLVNLENKNKKEIILINQFMTNFWMKIIEKKIKQNKINKKIVLEKWSIVMMKIKKTITIAIQILK